jgi:crotonobetainyl-CoA:carnitine CoA-transferase CaiB-like acyl-CoA transferase
MPGTSTISTDTTQPEVTTPPLEGLRVVDLSDGIAGGYCTKALADGGAEVVKVEPPEGDSLRHWAIGARLDPDVDGPLFEFLACSKRSVVADPERKVDRDEVAALLRTADVIVWTRGSRVTELPEFAPDRLHRLAPQAIVVAITPFGLEGPWASAASSDLTLQAWAGSVFSRGSPDRPPAQIGGRPAEWLGGLFAAVGVLAAWQRTVQTGVGELLDVSVLESMVLTGQMYGATKQSTIPPGAKAGPEREPGRAVMIPSIERARDDWVGFMVATATMWESFCVMVEHPEWIEDQRLYAYAGRALRRAELEAAIREWVERHTTGEVLEMADLLRVPAAPMGNGARVTELDHFVERNFYVRHPKSGLLQPDVSYTLGGRAGRRFPTASPALGEHSLHGEARHAPPLPIDAASTAAGRLPLEGVRVADFTAFWAGPIVGHFLAMMGADVIHVESVKRPDGIRGHTVVTTSDDLWWEWTPQFHGPNTNKRDITLDMATEDGRRLGRRLVAECDVMLENYAPRVMDQWGLGWEVVRGLRPDLIFVRMPAFGLSGPWRNRTGYAQNMEQVSGMAWMTGSPEGPPHVPNGICDPLAGTHATLALLLALEHRRKTGEGMLIEVPMVGGAMNVAAEQVLEYQAFGHLMQRDGNRGPAAAPQNVYRCADVQGDGAPDAWVALAVETDDQWRDLCRALGRTDTPAAWDSAEGRRKDQDDIDRWIGEWCRELTGDEVVARLWPAGVPVAKVLAPAEVQHVEQLKARRFLETVTHPVAGDQIHYGYPVRFGAGPDRFHRRPAPTLGQHNHEVLVDLLGVEPAEYERLLAADVIGTRLLGEHRTR